MKTRALLFGLVAATVVAASPALAQSGSGGGSGGDDPRFCPNRPSLGSSACTTEPGHVQFEYSALDWQRDDTADARDDQFIVADLLARIGIGPQTEVQVGWTAFGTDRERNKAAGGVTHTNGVGDVRLAVRQNLRNPGGDGLSFGIEPFVILPLGRQPIGDGAWEGGAVIPVTYDLSKSLNLAFTGQVAALADEDGHGRHLNDSGIVGLGYQVSEQVTLTSEVSVERDDDPMGGETHVLAAESIAFKPTRRTQLDLLAAAGLNHSTPDIRLAFGGAILF
ncbi:Putative MetA-pathway of phenol degradation [Sphingomonas gellani]|uniref:Putative MetA-pathway of phenol degradation n=1 Tax=Sphingomonas gellani TaxID=1166340 RepID=A0A1H8FLX2_9SPHN|nr:transporter [Sphingomonas gellani]SEN32615.1 Putative MetA-pathway of phenol degradation [Sphingomonas gellani]